MKLGKFIPLGYYNNFKLGYGTVDFKNLKTIYLKINSWILPEEIDDFDKIIYKSKRSIKDYIYNLHSNLFQKECIVDFDVKTKGIKLCKKSFMSIEIILYNRIQFDIKNKIVKEEIKNIFENIILNNLLDKKTFKFHKRKN